MSTEINKETKPAGGLVKKDFLSQTEPRWCLGCGCYSVFNRLTGMFPTMGVPREKFAIISGIGCSSRLPYYASTYGFHTIHGRAPTVAMGLKMARPELSVWVISGDGDLLSIGGNHFIHLIRRNPDIKVILFNNQIYGLTKGQASPTTRAGTKTKTTPGGAFDSPMKPLAMAIAAGATFAARVTDTDGEMLTEVMSAAAAHKGVAFIEVMMNCVIFNDGAFTAITDKTSRLETTVRLQHGKPLLFGANQDKGIRLKNFSPEVVKVGEGGANASELAVHDIASPDSSLAYLLSQMDQPRDGQPVPLGIFRQVSAPIYTEVAGMQSPADDAAVARILRGSASWVEGEDGGIRSSE
ncbi:MAG: 2-oxoacid:ferredoxin oxidoreductase subunit beta [Oligoflexia bacterium]|nr:2-oxoacid:ferredoxin oxidoreductase subunit beta [Oligoflexia bacterium]